VRERLYRWIVSTIMPVIGIIRLVSQKIEFQAQPFFLLDKSTKYCQEMFR